VRRVIGRLVAAALAVGLVVFAAVTESDTARLSAQRTAAAIARPYGPGATASCEEKHGYWDYQCRVHREKGTVTIDVRVDEHKIVDRSSG